MINFRLEVIAYWAVPLVVFLAILVGGIYFAFRSSGSDGQAEPSEQLRGFYSASGEIRIPELFDSYLIATGGRAGLEGIRSIRYKGRLIEPDTEIPFQILLSLPDKGMIITAPGEEHSQRLVYNGGLAWQEVNRGDGTRNYIRLSEEDTVLLGWSLRFHNSFRNLVLNEEHPHEGFSAREITFSDAAAIELTKTMPDGSDWIVVLDRESLRMLMMEESAPSSKGTERVRAVYEDHRMISGVSFSFRTKFYKEGRLYNETVIESVETNPGLVSMLFRAPEEISGE